MSFNPYQNRLQNTQINGVNNNPTNPLEGLFGKPSYELQQFQMRQQQEQLFSQFLQSKEGQEALEYINLAFGDWHKTLTEPQQPAQDTGMAQEVSELKKMVEALTTTLAQKE